MFKTDMGTNTRGFRKMILKHSLAQLTVNNLFTFCFPNLAMFKQTHDFIFPLHQSRKENQTMVKVEVLLKIKLMITMNKKNDLNIKYNNRFEQLMFR